MPRKTQPVTPAGMIWSMIAVVLIAVLLGFAAKTGMEIVNRKLGLDDDPSVTETGQVIEDLPEVEVPEMPEYEPVEMTESGSAVWDPDWKATPCTLFVSSDGAGIIDSLPQAPDRFDRPTELQLLMELWGSHSGYGQTEIDRVWAFSSGDTCFIDLPRSPDWTAVRLTIESRFISYTLMYPFVAGEPVTGYEEGIPVRGIPSN